MKPPPNHSLDRLLRTARRRWIVRRAFEAASIGSVFACCVSLMLIAILWWQAESSINLTAGLVIGGALLGALMSLIARPSPTRTARRLDEHHKLHDLLATAEYLIEARRDDDSMQGEIIRRANHTAHELRPAATTFARISAAQQTAIVALVGLTLTVAAMASSHVERSAGPVVESRNGATAPLAAARKNSLEKGTKENHKLAPASEAIQARSTANDSSKTDGAGNAVTKSESRDGNAFAKSDATQKPMAISPGAGSSSDRGIAASGGAGGNAGGDPARPGAAASASANPRQVDLSPRSRDAALKLLNNGGVPDAYRDLVRDYFLRD